MNDLQSHIVNTNINIVQAISKLDKLSELGKALTLFVCDSNSKIIGALTDGDIRRGIIRGLDLESPVDDFMVKSFSFVKEDDIDVNKISAIRDEGIKLLPVLNSSDVIVRIYDFRELKSVLPVECMIMAGGRGERLRPLTDRVPKPMLRVGKKPILEHNIDRLISFGINKIYISIRYLGDQIINYFGDGAKKNISISYVKEEKALGTGGALALVDSFHSNYILLMNSDLFTDIDFEEFYIKAINENADMAIASTPYTVNIPYAILEHDNHSVHSFKEKPSNTHYANAGIYLIKKEWLKLIPKDEFFNITELMQMLIEQGHKVIHNSISGYWIDIGKPDDLKRAQSIAEHFK